MPHPFLETTTKLAIESLASLLPNGWRMALIVVDDDGNYKTGLSPGMTAEVAADAWRRMSHDYIYLPKETK